jgi:hypothetical protein
MLRDIDTSFGRLIMPDFIDAVIAIGTIESALSFPLANN